MQSISSSVKVVAKTEGSSELMDTEAPAPSMRCTGCCGHGGAEASYLHAPVSSEDVGQTWPKALGPRDSGYHDLDLIVSLLSLFHSSPVPSFQTHPNIQSPI